MGHNYRFGRVLLVFTLMGGHISSPSSLPATPPEKRPNLEGYFPPRNVAERLEVFENGSPQFVILIEDIHAHFEAQSNIEKLLESIAPSFGVWTPQDLLIEGASGPVDTSLLEGMTARVKHDLREILFRKGLISGAENYCLGKYPFGPVLWGAEWPTDYRSNLAAFHKAVKSRPVILKSVLASQQKHLRSLNPAARNFFTAWKDFLKGEVPLSSFLDTLSIHMRKRNDECLRLVSHGASRSELKNLMKEMVEYRKFVIFWEKVKQSSTPDIQEIHRKICRMAQKIAKALALKKHGVDFADAWEALIQQERLAELRWTREDYLNRKASYPKAFHNALQFYHLAMKRDLTLSQNTLALLKEKNVPSIVLVVGGFHREGVTRILKEQGISYVVFRPKFRSEAYFEKYETFFLKPFPSFLDSFPTQLRLAVPSRLFNALSTPNVFQRLNLLLAIYHKALVALPLLSARPEEARMSYEKEKSRWIEYLRKTLLELERRAPKDARVQALAHLIQAIEGIDLDLKSLRVVGHRVHVPLIQKGQEPGTLHTWVEYSPQEAQTPLGPEHLTEILEQDTLGTHTLRFTNGPHVKMELSSLIAGLLSAQNQDLPWLLSHFWEESALQRLQPSKESKAYWDNLIHEYSKEIFPQKDRPIVELLSNALTSVWKRGTLNTPQKVHAWVDERGLKVVDRGQGMSLRTILTDFLILGLSGTRGTDGIGQFGVGFHSVLRYLTSEDDRVIVTTNDGQTAHQLHFYLEGETPMVDLYPFPVSAMPQGTEVKVNIKGPNTFDPASVVETARQAFQFTRRGAIVINDETVNARALVFQDYEQVSETEIGKHVFFSKSRASRNPAGGGRLDVVKDEVTLFSLETTGFNMPEEVIIKVPKSVKIPIERDKMKVGRDTLAFFKALMDELALHPESLSLLSAFYPLVQELQEWNTSAEKGHNLLTYFHSKIRQCLPLQDTVLPDLPEFHQVDIPDAKFIHPQLYLHFEGNGVPAPWLPPLEGFLPHDPKTRVYLAPFKEPRQGVSKWGHLVLVSDQLKPSTLLEKALLYTLLNYHVTDHRHNVPGQFFKPVPRESEPDIRIEEPSELEFEFIPEDEPSHHAFSRPFLRFMMQSFLEGVNCRLALAGFKISPIQEPWPELCQLLARTFTQILDASDGGQSEISLKPYLKLSLRQDLRLNRTAIAAFLQRHWEELARRMKKTLSPTFRVGWQRSLQAPDGKELYDVEESEGGLEFFAAAGPAGLMVLDKNGQLKSHLPISHHIIMRIPHETDIRKVAKVGNNKLLAWDARGSAILIYGQTSEKTDWQFVQRIPIPNELKPQALAGDIHGNIFILDSSSPLIHIYDALGHTVGKAPSNPSSTVPQYTELAHPIQASLLHDLALLTFLNDYLSEGDTPTFSQQSIGPLFKIPERSHLIQEWLDFRGADRNKGLLISRDPYFRRFLLQMILKDLEKLPAHSTGSVQWIEDLKMLLLETGFRHWKHPEDYRFWVAYCAIWKNLPDESSRLRFKHYFQKMMQPLNPENFWTTLTFFENLVEFIKTEEGTLLFSSEEKVRQFENWISKITVPVFASCDPQVFRQLDGELWTTLQWMMDEEEKVGADQMPGLARVFFLGAVCVSQASPLGQLNPGKYLDLWKDWVDLPLVQLQNDFLKLQAQEPTSPEREHLFYYLTHPDLEWENLQKIGLLSPPSHSRILAQRQFNLARFYAHFIAATDDQRQGILASPMDLRGFDQLPESISNPLSMETAQSLIRTNINERSIEPFVFIRELIQNSLDAARNASAFVIVNAVQEAGLPLDWSNPKVRERIDYKIRQWIRHFREDPEAFIEEIAESNLEFSRNAFAFGTVGRILTDTLTVDWRAPRFRPRAIEKIQDWIMSYEENPGPIVTEFLSAAANEAMARFLIEKAQEANIQLPLDDPMALRSQIFQWVSAEELTRRFELSRQPSPIRLADAVRRKYLDIELAGGSAGEIVLSSTDAVGMTLREVLEFLLTPGTSSKPARDPRFDRRKGVGFLSVFEDATEVEVLSSKGAELIHLVMQPLRNREGMVIDVNIQISIMENSEAFRGTRALWKTRSEKLPLLASRLHSKAREYAQTVPPAEMAIRWQHQDLNEALTVLGRKHVPELGTLTFYKSPTKKSLLTRRGMKIQTLSVRSDIFGQTPRPIVENLLKQGVVIELPRRTPISESGNDIASKENFLPSLQSTVTIQALEIALRSFIEGSSALGLEMLPYDYLKAMILTRHYAPKDPQILADAQALKEGRNMNMEPYLRERETLENRLLAQDRLVQLLTVLPMIEDPDGGPRMSFLDLIERVDLKDGQYDAAFLNRLTAPALITSLETEFRKIREERAREKASAQALSRPQAALQNLELPIHPVPGFDAYWSFHAWFSEVAQFIWDAASPGSKPLDIFYRIENTGNFAYGGGGAIIINLFTAAPFIQQWAQLFKTGLPEQQAVLVLKEFLETLAHEIAHLLEPPGARTHQEAFYAIEKGLIFLLIHYKRILLDRLEKIARAGYSGQFQVPEKLEPHLILSSRGPTQLLKRKRIFLREYLLGLQDQAQLNRIFERLAANTAKEGTRPKFQSAEAAILFLDQNPDTETAMLQEWAHIIFPDPQPHVLYFWALETVGQAA